MCKEQLFSKDVARENPCCNARTRRVSQLSHSALLSPSFMVTVSSDQSLPVAWESIALSKLPAVWGDKMEQISPIECQHNYRGVKQVQGWHRVEIRQNRSKAVHVYCLTVLFNASLCCR